jgi:hypothetical protein
LLLKGGNEIAAAQSFRDATGLARHQSAKSESCARRRASPGCLNNRGIAIERALY